MLSIKHITLVKGKVSTIIFLVFFLAFYSQVKAQYLGGVDRKFCEKIYSNLNLKLKFICDAEQELITDSTLHLSYLWKNKYNGAPLELVKFKYRKYQPGMFYPVNIFLKTFKKEAEERLAMAKKDLKVTYEDKYENSSFKPNAVFQDNLIYTTYAYLESKEKKQKYLFYDEINLIYDRGMVASMAVTTTIKVFTSDSEAEKYKNIKDVSPRSTYFYCNPIRIELNNKEPYKNTSPALGLNFELPVSYLTATENRIRKEVTIDYALLNEEVRAQYDFNPPMTLNLVKKMTPKEKFQTVVNNYLKNGMNQSDPEGYHRDYNIYLENLIFKDSSIFNSSLKRNEQIPFRYIFEINRTVYDFQTNTKQADIAGKILKLIEINKNNVPAGSTVQNENLNPYQYLDQVMSEWLYDNLESAKGDKIGAKSIKDGQRFQTPLEFNKYKTEIIEKGTTNADERRDWVVYLGAFGTESAAKTEFDKWVGFINDIHDERFGLRIKTQSDQSVLWKPLHAVASLTSKFFDLEIEVLKKPIVQTVNGKAVTKYQVLLKMGSKLKS